ncbi:hypothetical protein [Kitasatospora sp. NBC_01266]|uniref:hypothetical protein n=1 Tax=Kitasatospora sp. NBC_01266 TaxID=2903572 RepID=UPI002E347953|nr:hypothetical protein [Kitasatospora sp. NBC_01266]
MATRSEEVHPADPRPAGPTADSGPARRPRASAKGEQTRARLIEAARSLLAGAGQGGGIHCVTQPQPAP